ncbi:M14 family metallopeptidase [Gramella jeungdoensis]|uniref:M14 family metallopeptidase n=1 Tax=Gramella jeungdoensis TaxID=708091 RepID=A0ABT0YWQ4_9FLAO|nr:M14 metallopeptidase family protein [Gramella jeungdoensis]MCM8567888.1 M14 family metallopeptidase [Gramella jeungdoensis]
MEQNKINTLLSFLMLFCFVTTEAQTFDFAKRIADSYEKFRNENINTRRFKHSDLLPLIEKFKERPGFEFNKVGESIEGRSLNLISLGNGETDVFLWSQMHGDESTATMAILDILNFFDSKEFENEKDVILKNLRIHFLPMLNPDGAEVFTRRNALGVDVNRDALRLQSPESRTLKRVRDSLDADFGFNLHDQSRYYNAERTAEPASISFLAPAFNYEKDINEVRSNAMKLIVIMNEILQKYAPGKVGRYNDDFEPRAFGDNIQKWGTSTILIESGGYPEDREKQEIRKLNFVAILSALHSIATNSFQNVKVEEYEKIPNNDRMLFDLKLEKVSYVLGGDEYILDIGINRNENDIENNTDFYYSSRVADQGDLSTSYAYESFNADGYTLDFGKIYPQTLQDTTSLKSLNFSQLLREGVGYVKIKNLPANLDHASYPVNIVSEDFKINSDLRPGNLATFFLRKNGKIEYAVINGFLVKPETASEEVMNALVLD